MKTTRRRFIAGASASAAALLAGCGKSRPHFSGSIVGGAAAAGHRLRNRSFPVPIETLETGLVIVGGGVAGLAAARRLAQRGRNDVLLLELEGETGGSAMAGQNHVSPYPWGAHYVPLPNEESREVLELFEELGITRGSDASGAPIYEEEYLCADPMERLFDAGRWQEGLLPQIGISSDDRRQYGEFFARIETLRDMRGSDGRPAFAIPLDLSSRDAVFLAPDRITMADWMTQEGLDSAPLRWLVDYSCRDDYGAGLTHVSAWAGLHYFASRRARAANAEPDAVVTWPEGNGWIARQLAQPFQDRIRRDCLAFRIGEGEVDFVDLARGRSVRVRANGVVCATPRFVAQRLIPELPVAEGLEYSPWMVANVTIDELPAGRGAALAWDNVARDSASLGYVVATHQSLRPVTGATVLTHYWPLDSDTPRAERERALGHTHRDWCQLVAADLERMHPGIERHIRNIDIWLWGHGMIRPVPGFIWGETRARLQQPHGNVVFAHSDMSGISIFEEAFTRGTQAADTVLNLLA